MKLTKQDMTEYDRYYNPVPQVVDKLPDVKSVRDYTEVLIKQSDGSIKSYKMIQGQWYLVGSFTK